MAGIAYPRLPVTFFLFNAATAAHNVLFDRNEKTCIVTNPNFSLFLSTTQSCCSLQFPSFADCRAQKISVYETNKLIWFK